MGTDMEISLAMMAAQEIVAAFEIADWLDAQAILITSGADPFWDALELALVARAVDVTRQDSKGMGNAELLCSLQRLNYPSGSLIIVQDPVDGGAHESICDSVREITDTGIRIAFVEYPSPGGAHASRLRPYYLRALAYPVSQLVRLMRTQREALSLDHTVLASGNSKVGLTVTGIYDDFSVLGSAAPIMQFPLGEVWLKIGRASCRERVF